MKKPAARKPRVSLRPSCVLCGKTWFDWDEVLEEAVPSFWSGQAEVDGPVCGECSEKHLDCGDGYEFTVKPAAAREVARRLSYFKRVGARVALGVAVAARHRQQPLQRRDGR